MSRTTADPRGAPGCPAGGTPDGAAQWNRTMPEPEAKPEAPAAPKRKLPVTLLAVVGVAVVEAAVFFIVFKSAGAGPKPVHGEESHAIEPPATKPAGVAEVTLLKSFRVPNDKTGLMFLYDMEVSVVVGLADKERMETLVKERASEIGDRVARIMRAASDRVLREDDLRALRLQIQEALGEITGSPDLVQRVLIPRFVPIRSD